MRLPLVEIAERSRERVDAALAAVGLATERTMAERPETRNARSSPRTAGRTHDYFIDERLEAGIVLSGTRGEVAARRAAATSAEAYAGERGGEIYLINAYIPEYQAANRFNHETRRPRKLLLHRREVEGSGRRPRARA